MSRETQFKPGQSGNPKGRPRKAQPLQASAYDVLFDTRISGSIDGTEQALQLEQALHQHLLKDALDGKRSAMRRVVKMIAEWEAAHAKQGRRNRAMTNVTFHHTSEKANEAMRLLDIAQPSNDDPSRWRLNTWVTQAALSRPGGAALDSQDIATIKSATDNADRLKWPRGYRP